MNKESKKQANKYLAKTSDYQDVFKSEKGKRVLYDLMHVHFMMSTTYVRGDNYESAMREGERQVVIRILSKLKIDLKQMEQLIKEADAHESQTTI